MMKTIEQPYAKATDKRKIPALGLQPEVFIVLLDHTRWAGVYASTHMNKIRYRRKRTTEQHKRTK